MEDTKQKSTHCVIMKRKLHTGKKYLQNVYPKLDSYAEYIKSFHSSIIKQLILKNRQKL